MIERFDKAVGLRLPVWNNRQVEIWACPRGTAIQPHFHRTIDSLLVFLFGRMRITVGDTTRTVLGLFRRRESNGAIQLSARRIPVGVTHSAEALGFAVFINFEHCHSTRQSAAKDFNLVS